MHIRQIEGHCPCYILFMFQRLESISIELSRTCYYFHKCILSIKNIPPKIFSWEKARAPGNSKPWKEMNTLWNYFIFFCNYNIFIIKTRSQIAQVFCYANSDSAHTTKRKNYYYWCNECFSMLLRWTVIVSSGYSHWVANKLSHQ